MTHIAHIRQSDGQVQTIRSHLLETQALAELFGEKLKIRHLAGLAGVFHDVGKYSEAFQEYIQAAVYHPETAPRRGSVDHSTAGGQLLYNLFHSSGTEATLPGMVAEIVGNAIFSHHANLQDFITPDMESAFLRRVQKPLDGLTQMKELFFAEVMTETELSSYVDQAAAEMAAFFRKEPQVPLEIQFMFLSKFVFSMLIDADRTSTQRFAENQQLEPRSDHMKMWDTYSARLQQELDRFVSDTPINQFRNKLSAQCARFAERPPGIYTLTIPTGGGKTLASLRYALQHAKLYGKQRIVYILPYTTIIDQNVKEVRRILQDPSNILEHHSNVIDDTQDEEELREGVIDAQQKLRLARDNWDIPIIFTTMVQFLNAFYGGGTRNIRRLHQLSNTVLIFDEVQKVPLSCVALFNQALNFLHTRAGASIVLCTATQPALDFVEQRFALRRESEMITDLTTVGKALKRVNIIDRATGQTFDTEQLADLVVERVSKVPSVLVVLNTRSVVRKLYDQLHTRNLDKPVYHLSTMMCAAHRQQILQEIKEQLDAGKPVICVSTQLIEAGVDISFACVIRSLAGLDSIAQAAGRCNRHGEQKIQDVYVIDHAEEDLSKLPEIKQGKRVTQAMLVDLQRGEASFDDLLSPPAIERYFQEYYQDQKHNLKYCISSLQEDMTELLWTTRRESSYLQAYIHEKQQPFLLTFPHSYGTAAKHFRAIDQSTTSVIAPYDGGVELIAELNSYHSSEKWSHILRQAQPYLVQLYEHELEQLSRIGALQSHAEGNLLTLTEQAYDKKYGLDLEMDAEMKAPFT